MRAAGFLSAFLVAAVAFAALVATGAVAAAQGAVVVPTRVIYPGETVSHDLLRSVEVTNPRAVVTGMAILPQDAGGKVARRTLLPGRMIPLASLREPYAVEAGAPVEVRFVAGALTISLTGVPLQPGAVGDMVRVRNTDSGATFTGVVLADGTVTVGHR